jgi:transcription elongation factor GreA
MSSPAQSEFYAGLLPVGPALIGKTKGATVEVEAPGGAKAYKIRRVQWPEDILRNREQSRK